MININNDASIVVIQSMQSKLDSVKVDFDADVENKSLSKLDSVKVDKLEKGNIVEASSISFDKNIDMTKYFNGFKNGDEINVDGPLWYDGNAKLNKLEKDSFSISLNMKFPDIDKLSKMLGLGDDVSIPYKVVDGKLNIDISTEKLKNGFYQITIKDKNNSDKIFTMSNMKSEISGDDSVKIQDKYNNIEFKTDGLNCSEINLNGISLTLKK